MRAFRHDFESAERILGVGRLPQTTHQRTVRRQPTALTPIVTATVVVIMALVRLRLLPIRAVLPLLLAARARRPAAKRSRRREAEDESVAWEGPALGISAAAGVEELHGEERPGAGGRSQLPAPPQLLVAQNMSSETFGLRSGGATG